MTFDKRVHLCSRISGQRACPFPPAASRLVSAWTGVPVLGTVSVPGISRTACRGGSSTVGPPLPLLLCCRAVLVHHVDVPLSAPVSPVDGRAAGFQAVAKAVLRLYTVASVELGGTLGPHSRVWDSQNAMSPQPSCGLCQKCLVPEDSWRVSHVRTRHDAQTLASPLTTFLTDHWAVSLFSVCRSPGFLLRE